MAERGLSPLANRRFGKAIPSLPDKCLPNDDRLLFFLLPEGSSSQSVCVEDEAEAADDTGGVKAFGSAFCCSIEVSASLSDSDEISSTSLPSIFGEVGAVGSPVCGLARKCLVMKSPMAIFTATESGRGQLWTRKSLRKACTNLCEIAVHNSGQTFVHRIGLWGGYPRRRCANRANVVVRIVVGSTGKVMYSQQSFMHLGLDHEMVNAQTESHSSDPCCGKMSDELTCDGQQPVPEILILGTGA